MVSKVAVIALVAIVACPILLGYAMNLNEVTITDYRASNDNVNVTPLLQNGSEYSVALADVYTLNSNFSYFPRIDIAPIIPIYQKFTSTTTALPLSYTYATFPSNGSSHTDSLSSINKYYVIWDYGYSGYVNMTIRGSTTPDISVSQVKEIYYDKVTDTITYIYGANNINTISGGTYTDWTWTNSSGATIHTIYGAQNVSSNNRYVDISAGFCFRGNTLDTDPIIKLPELTKSATITINLDSITDPNYSFALRTRMGNLWIDKTTNAGVVSWGVRTTYSGTNTPIYYDPDRTDNTYQITITYEYQFKDGADYTYYNVNYDFKYVGSWPSIIGKANYFTEYTFDQLANLSPGTPDKGLDFIWLDYISSDSQKETPIVRMDEAAFNAFEIPIIENKTYSPASLKTNPSTTINDVSVYGYSLSFGGNTYAVTNGKITLGSHQIPVKGLVFSSVPVAGGYENRIGNSVISTTAAPSTIEFNGKWSASISTASMESYTYTHTEWTPGQFAWNGIDQNFLMVGLLTSVGVFIGLSIYIRRTGASLWPLLLVCGGAAVLFFTML